MIAGPPRLLAELEALACLAADVVMQVYRQDFAVARKDDASPVTEADRRAEALIVDGLQRLDPGTAVVAEEAVSAGAPAQPALRFWLVDPLDGTREFVSRNGEFTVNIALVEAGEPVLGVVVAPVSGCCWSGAAGVGAWRTDRACDGARQVRRQVAARAFPADGGVLAVSRSHDDTEATDGWLARAFPQRRFGIRRVAGSSLKFGLLAEGAADLYPRLTRTMEWDTAAGHAVLRAAGGEVCTLDGRPLRYGKPGFVNPAFYARGVA